MKPFLLKQGTRPLLLSIPHVGQYIEEALAQRMMPDARGVPDTDWHLDRLYDFADELGASVLLATHSRYVIDLNRPPDDRNLYPGQDTTGLCPVDTFDRTPIYRAGQELKPDEVLSRRSAIWDPWHQALEDELKRLRALHPKVVLWEAHSIRSVLPRFFTGKLPDLNFGTANGKSCDPRMAERVMEVAAKAGGYVSMLNGRFTGGYNTRQYGRPEEGVHAMQLEMTQCTYMEESPPFAYKPELAQQVRPHLRAMLEATMTFAES
jgi:N-formylglutamate deformylase